MGFQVKSVDNCLDRNKMPRNLFKIELLPETTTTSASKQTHPIYGVRYIHDHKVTILEATKSTTMVQCHNCQQFGDKSCTALYRQFVLLVASYPKAVNATKTNQMNQLANAIIVNDIIQPIIEAITESYLPRHGFSVK